MTGLGVLDLDLGSGHSVWVAESGVLFLCDRWQVQGYWIRGTGPGMLDLGDRVRGAGFWVHCLRSSMCTTENGDLRDSHVG